MTNYQLMSTQITLPSAKPPLMRPPVQTAARGRRNRICMVLNEEAKMFIRVAMIHCGECLLHTQPTDRSPPPPPANTHKNAASPQPEKHSAPSRRNFNLLQPCWSHKLRQEGGSLFCLSLSNRVNGQGHGGWLGGYYDGDWWSDNPLIYCLPKSKSSTCTSSLMKETPSYKALCSTDMRNK